MSLSPSGAAGMLEQDFCRGRLSSGDHFCRWQKASAISITGICRKLRIHRMVATAPASAFGAPGCVERPKHLRRPPRKKRCISSSHPTPTTSDGKNASLTACTPYANKFLLLAGKYVRSSRHIKAETYGRRSCSAGHKPAGVSAN